MTRHFVQMRMNAQDPRFYSPDRDIAHCSYNLIGKAITGLDPEKQEPWIRTFLEANKLTTDDLAKGAEVVAKYMNDTMLDPEHKEPLDALAKAGFFDLPESVQTIVLAKIGQVYIATFFTAIRDVTRDPDEDKPATVKNMTKVAEDFMHKIYVKRAMPQWRRTLYDWWLLLKEKLGLFGVNPAAKT